MKNQISRDILIERRKLNEQEKNCWQQLTLSQKFSASSLINYGYQLVFVRNSEAGSLAVLLKQYTCTTIADDGEINTNPNINIRA